MKDLYEKLCIIVGEILCYSHKVCWASAPRFGEGVIILEFKDYNSQSIEIEVPHIKLIKLHDHSLENYIFELAKEKGIL